jgi:hypothetical protein
MKHFVGGIFFQPTGDNGVRRRSKLFQNRFEVVQHPVDAASLGRIPSVHSPQGQFIAFNYYNI